jgi:hypothetical protein
MYFIYLDPANAMAFTGYNYSGCRQRYISTFEYYTKIVRIKSSTRCYDIKMKKQKNKVCK